MAELPSPRDLQRWIEQRSTGVPPLTEPSTRADLSEAALALIEAHQWDAFRSSVQARRRGEAVVDQDFLAFESLVETGRIEGRTTAFRGLATVGVDVGLLNDPAPSCWSLYPSVALRLGLANTPASDEPAVTILRETLPAGARGLYVGGFEAELMRPASLNLRAMERVHGSFDLLGMTIDVTLIAVES